MTKYRSRTIVEARVWQPGTQIDGVHELRDGRALLEHVESSGMLGGLRHDWFEIKPGHTVFTERNDRNEVIRRSSYGNRERFERDWEDIGG